MTCPSEACRLPVNGTSWGVHGDGVGKCNRDGVGGWGPEGLARCVCARTCSKLCSKPRRGDGVARELLPVPEGDIRVEEMEGKPLEAEVGSCRRRELPEPLDVQGEDERGRGDSDAERERRPPGETAVGRRDRLRQLHDLVAAPGIHGQPRLRQGALHPIVTSGGKGDVAEGGPGRRREQSVDSGAASGRLELSAVDAEDDLARLDRGPPPIPSG